MVGRGMRRCASGVGLRLCPGASPQRLQMWLIRSCRTSSRRRCPSASTISDETLLPLPASSARRIRREPFSLPPHPETTVFALARFYCKHRVGNGTFTARRVGNYRTTMSQIGNFPPPAPPKPEGPHVRSRANTNLQAFWDIGHLS